MSVALSQKISGTATNTSWVSYTPTFSAFPAESSVQVQSRRDGSDLLIRAKVTFAAGGTASEGRMTLGYAGTNGNVTSAGSAVIPSIQQAGPPGALSVNAAGQYLPLIEPSVGYLTFGIQSVGGAGLTKTSGSSIAGGTYTFTARVPINGWD